MTPDDPAFMAMVETVNPSAASQIKAMVAEATGITVADIMGPSRKAKFFIPRYMCIRLMRRRGWSTTKIGWIMNRDHSSIVNALKRAEALWGPIDAPTSPASVGTAVLTQGERAEPQTPRPGARPSRLRLW